MKLNKKLSLTIVRDLFTLLFVLFVVFSFLELLKPRIVLNYINVDLYLMVLILLGVITIIYNPLEKKDYKMKFLDYFLISCFSILIGFLIIYLTRGIGLLSILIGLIGVIISYLLIILILKGR